MSNGETGKCVVRQNVNGILRSMFYSKPHMMKHLPIEDIGFYHVEPGKDTLVVGMVGKNLIERNEDIKKIEEEIEVAPKIGQTPSQVIDETKVAKTNIISHAYQEPLVSYEYVLDILERSKEVKNLLVTNGFFNNEPLREIVKNLRAVLISLKSFDSEFYKENYNAKLEQILKSIRLMKENDVWIELRYNVDNDKNENLYEIRKMVLWILNNLGSDVPLHLYSKNANVELLKRARISAINAGLKYVYTRSDLEDEKTTFCPNCNIPVIIRNTPVETILNNGMCKCGEKIAGVWE
jgi:pyruvate formate lyase activating enzyme